MGAMTRVADADQVRIIESAVTGDELAFARIVAEHQARMYRVCVFVCGDEQVAAVTVQAAIDALAQQSADLAQTVGYSVTSE